MAFVCLHGSVCEVLYHCRVDNIKPEEFENVNVSHADKEERLANLTLGCPIRILLDISLNCRELFNLFALGIGSLLPSKF